MSVLNVCTTDIDRNLGPYRNSISSVPEHKISSLYRRFSWSYQPSSTGSYDTFSSYTASSRNSSFEAIFSRLLDVLIFTSAIAITAYSYLTGTLDQAYVEGPPSSRSVGYHPHKRHSVSSGTRKNNEMIYTHIVEDSKRRRTQEWAEQQIPQEPLLRKRYSSSSSLSDRKVQLPSSKSSHNKSHMKRDKRRTQSLPVNEPVEKQDEALTRMEEQLQILIDQCHDALSSTVDISDTN
ncbi:hypothetical protein BDB01DRAFT_831986 [Pilobolus umbonatus]|nr:hypothetical protein BDB01DRAFT_831986 [Pilobolus umbonatus]